MTKSQRADNLKRFPGLSHLAYQHPADLKAIQNLRKIPVLPIVMKWISKNYLEEVERIKFLGSNIRLSPRQCPRIYAMFQEAAAILDMHPLPEIYLNTQYQVNAYAFGMHRYFIVLYSGLVDILSEDELMGVIGHELSHVKCEHMLYKTVAVILSDVVGGAMGQIFSIGQAALIPLQLALCAWSRRAELSCDRAALLVTQNPSVMASSLAKLAGASAVKVSEINMEEVYAQAKEFEDIENRIYIKALKGLQIAGMTHPFCVYRSREVALWGDSDEYRKILAGDYLRREEAASRCQSCGAALKPGIIFCPGCGQALKPMVACAKCKEKIDPAWGTCPYCGTPQAATAAASACVKCGAKLEVGWAFCKGCGTKVAARSAEAGECPSCGAAAGTGAKFCSACGAAIAKGKTAPRKSKCRSCGKEVSRGIKFCPGCGNKLQSAKRKRK
ncbi:MAG: M48 family metallopeptidase [bacterium]|nr:M48 family metallopeptidase [bacterium]